MDKINTGSKLKKTILLVEDEKVVSKATSEVLSYLGYHVLTADNGYEALQAYKNQHEAIDLILLDLQMPIMDGSETYRQLKQLNPKAKIILSTATQGDDQVLEKFNLKECGYIRKPYMPRELQDEINRILACN